MLIKVADPVFQTLVFSILFFAAIIISTRRHFEKYTLSHSHTNELKGVAILMVILAHTGYALSADTRFLFPLSVFAGVGVDLFLFLSGFGMSMSSLNTKLTLQKFYKKRLLSIYLPMWIVISILFILDLLLLNKTYSFLEIARSYLGYFPVADLYTSFNSPLWYFTFIAFYYLVFPLVFLRKAPWLSAIAIYILSTIVVKSNLSVNPSVLILYQLHILAFPIGMLFAAFSDKFSRSTYTFDFHRKLGWLWSVARPLLILLLTYIFAYTAINSGVGKGIQLEQTYSLITMTALLLIFILKKFQSGFLQLVGTYSYGIYLIQWPIMYRYDFLYKFMPASLATFAYIAVFIFLAYILKQIEKNILNVSN